MNSIILAGGFGTRLKPLTDSIPKPALKIANRPVLDYVTSQLRFYGIADAVFTLGYKPEIIREICENYDKITARFTVEDKPLGTAGAVKAAENMLDDVFLVMSGDAISDIDLGAMVAAHLNSDNLVTVALTTVPDPRRYGVARLDGDKITSFVEKPSDERFGRLVNAGVYVADKSVLNLIPGGTQYDFARDLFPRLVKTRKLGAFLHGGYWCDVGDKKSFYEANFYMSDGGFYPFVGSKTVPSVRRNGCLIGKNAIVTGSARYSIIGENAVVTSGAQIRDCVVLDGATVRGVHYGEIIGDGFVEKCRISERFPSLAENFYKEAPAKA